MGKRFLISRLSSLGDVVCSLPAAGALRAAFPDSEIVWAVDPRFAGIVECCRHVNEIIKVQPKLKPETWPKIEGEFDAALDLQGLLKSGLVLKGAKAKEKVGYHWQREGAWLFSSRILPDPTSIHIVDQYVDVARAVGGEASVADFGLVGKEEDWQEILVVFPDLANYVVINPGAGWVTKRWPPHQIAKLIGFLSQQGLQAVLIGSKSEEEQAIADEVVNLTAVEAKPSIKKLTGKTSIRQLVALLARAKAHVGGDTGSTHLAAALGTPAIGLYSITKPARSCPYGQVERCHFDKRGLGSIEPENVAITIQEALA